MANLWLELGQTGAASFTLGIGNWELDIERWKLECHPTSNF
jgi:hypothetical protein